MTTKKKIALVIPSMTSGGMERVMAEVANFLAEDTALEVHLISLSNKESFYQLSKNITFHKPQFKKTNKITYTPVVLNYLRNTVKQIAPYSILSFGSKYNSFVLLATLGLASKIYVSDRSNPYRNTYLTFKKNDIERHDGPMHFFLKRILYKKADGIIVQTKLAEEIETKTLKHHNIIYIPNPIRAPKKSNTIPNQSDIIINVGRFIKTKQQQMLVTIFNTVKFGNWKLMFVGEGPHLEAVKKQVNDLGLNEDVIFTGNQKEIDHYYQQAKIFAFTSASEGFPNVLGEAMVHQLPCISFDCVAGPRDLIVNDYNGYLIENGAVEDYTTKLKNLMESESTRNLFRTNTAQHIKNFDRDLILNKFKQVLIN